MTYFAERLSCKGVNLFPMKRIFPIVIFCLVLGCKQEQKQNETTVEVFAAAEWKAFGAEVDATQAVPVAGIPAIIANKDSLFLTLIGEAISSCAMKGCWMKVKLDEEEEMRVTFKEYAFFVPKDLAGEEVIFEGWLTQKVTDVETLRHYAKDEGAKQEDIDRISKPRKEYVFEASGVLLKR